MSSAQISLKTVFVAMTAGIVGAFFYTTLNKGVHHSVLDASFRHSEVDGYFAEFEQGKVIDTVSVPVFNDDVEVPIVASVRGARYGFLKSRNPVGQFWIQARGYRIYVYDDHHLFVVVSDWYVNEQKRAKHRAIP